jgi:DNA-binding transcriptional regulator YiaG
MSIKQTRQITIEEMKEYGEYFRNMRLSINYTQVQFSRLLGIHCMTYSKWELGKIIPQQDIYEIETKVRDIVKAAKVS